MKSIIWSFGVTFWEVFSYGKMPYGHKMDINDIKRYVTEGGRLECPVDCPPKVFELMNNCWQNDPNRRQNFTKILCDIKMMKLEGDTFFYYNFENK